MADRRGGFLIHFDEQQRAILLRERSDLEVGFSDALSGADWHVRQWEVCGLMFEPDTITHWALAQKGKGVATGKFRVEFLEVTPTSISLPVVEQLIGSLSRFIVRVRSGNGGSVPSRIWIRLKEVLKEVDPKSWAILERLERLRDQGDEPINRPGAEQVAQQKDAVGVALDVFDGSGGLRRQTLRAWTVPEGDRLESFLSGVDGVSTIEDQVVAHDASVFPGERRKRHTVIGTVFRLQDRSLEVFNVNRTAIENSLGVDLLYRNDEFDAWTLVQYKLMEGHRQDGEGLHYRPDAAFDKELQRMREFRAGRPDHWVVGDEPVSYRLCGDGFYFKLCSRVQLESLSDKLLPGMYLPRQYVECLLATGAASGPRGGRAITFENAGRHVSNTLFAELVRDAWIGTRGLSSQTVGEILREGVSSGRALVIGRGRRHDEEPDLRATLNELGMLQSISE